MKKMKYSILILAVCLTFSQLAFSQNKTEKDKVETRMVVIKGDNAWLKTNILLRPQDRVEVKAIGQVFFSSGHKLSGVTPNGMGRSEFDLNWEFDSQYCNDPEMEINHAALLGKVGSGRFLIGKNKTFTGKKGPLVIGINDCTFKNEFYNTGEFKATIKVYRGK